MTQVISVLNYKGGVAKTTTTLNLGTALWIMGMKVLLIDMDRQCNLTNTMGFKEQDGAPTMYEWLRNETDKLPIYDRYKGLHYIPSSHRMVNINSYLDQKRNREGFLKTRLNPVKDYFDYILIDCPPEEGIISDNAMVASDGVLITADSGPFAMEGMESLHASIEDLKINLNENLRIMGILRTKAELRTVVYKRASEYLSDNFKNELINVPIRKCTRFDESPARHQSIFEYAASSIGAEDYMHLAELLTKQKRPSNWKTKAAIEFRNIK